jgi:tetratricopeptide (TPR) repeat protein
MPMKNQGDRVQSWNEVHARFADTAKATPVEEIDRQLAAMGYDPSKVGSALAGLEAAGRRRAAPVRMAAAAASATAPFPPASRAAMEGPASTALRRGWNVPAGSLRARSATAGVFAVALAAVLALPLSQSVIGRWFVPGAGKVEKVSMSSVEQQVQLLIQSVAVASDPLGFARNLNRAGELLEAADRADDAASRYLEAIALIEGRSDKVKPSPLIATIAHNLARLLQAEERLDEAEKLLQRALEINLMHFGPDHPFVARDIASLDALHRARNMCTKPLKSCAI